MPLGCVTLNLARGLVSGQACCNTLPDTDTVHRESSEHVPLQNRAPTPRGYQQVASFPACRAAPARRLRQQQCREGRGANRLNDFQHSLRGMKVAGLPRHTASSQHSVRRGIGARSVAARVLQNVPIFAFSHSWSWKVAPFGVFSHCHCPSLPTGERAAPLEHLPS